MSKHTQGPWQYAFEGGTVAFILEADGTTVAKMSVTENSTAHRTLHANARLIAAAPDLLEALETCEAFLLSAGFASSDAYAKASAAIAKATGEQS